MLLLHMSKIWALRILKFCQLLNFLMMARGVTRLPATTHRPAALATPQTFSILLIICINRVLGLSWTGYHLISPKMERLLATLMVLTSTNMLIPARENIKNGEPWSSTMAGAK